MLFFKAMQKASIPGINIDLSAIDGKNLKVDGSSVFSDNSKDKITLKLILVAGSQSINFLPATTEITEIFSINFEDATYDVTQWTAPNYTFDNFKAAATTNIGTRAWKDYIAQSIDSKKAASSPKWVGGES